MTDLKVPVSGKLTKLDPRIWFIQGEDNAETVEFEINKRISGTDITGLDWQIEISSCATDSYYIDDLTNKDETGATINLTWVVSKNYTGKPARDLCAMLVGRLNGSLVTMLKIDGFGVLEACQAANVMTPDYWADLLNQFMELRDQAQEAANRAEEASGNPPYIGPNGNWFTFNVSTGQFEDTGVRARGPEGPSGPGTGDMLRSQYDPGDVVFDAGGISAYTNIESGSNSNGSYVKYPDGTLICTKTITNTSSFNVPIGNLFYSGFPVNAGDWAHAFIDTPTADFSITSSSWASFIIGTIGSQVTSTSTGTRLIVSPAQTAASQTANYCVTGTGRWK